VPGRTYEQKLIRALDHRLPDRRVIAAKVLGAIRSRAALPRLVELASGDPDPYVQAEAAGALAAIEPEHPLVRELSEHGPALTRAAVRGARA
jgi:HEAT repeat protein